MSDFGPPFVCFAQVVVYQIVGIVEGALKLPVWARHQTSARSVWNIRAYRSGRHTFGLLVPAVELFCIYPKSTPSQVKWLHLPCYIVYLFWHWALRPNGNIFLAVPGPNFIPIVSLKYVWQ